MRTAPDSFFALLGSVREALQSSYAQESHRFERSAGERDEALRTALRAWPTLYPQWTGPLEEYDSERFGPLLGVSDEGSAGRTIASAAYASSKARALKNPDAMSVGIIIDGERMTSAGEVPIGPDEYDEIIEAAFARTLCTTNVGVRANARLYQFLPEFRVSEAAADQEAWLGSIFARFKPFVETPSGEPRPLTIRLLVKPGASPGQSELLKELVPKIEAGRQDGKLGPASVHCLSLLIEFDNEIATPEGVEEVRRLLGLAAELGIPEVAVDGELLPGARRRLSLQSLLNVLDEKALQDLLAEAASRGIVLSYRYQLDTESAARTIWTGLHTARTYGLSAAKYGLVPLTLEEQERIVSLVGRWTKGWTAIPAFYVDTPLLTKDDVFDDQRCVDAALLWMQRIRAAGARVVLVDSPDRIRPRRLLREEGAADDRGVLTLSQIEVLQRWARDLGLKVLWSGGITPPQAFALAKLGVFGIFTTSSTARQIAVGDVLRTDPQLAAENEPTELGVRRVSALIQGGYLTGVLKDGAGQHTNLLEEGSRQLLKAIAQNEGIEQALATLDEALVEGWRHYWSSRSP